MPEHFFIVGAQRAGTSYLYSLLSEHPEIEMAKPLKPEPKFFLLEDLFARGIEYYQSQFFENKQGIKIQGEKSTCYIESEKVAQRISHFFPGAKIIFILRDPIQRAISNYWLTANNGLEKLPLDKAFIKEEDRWSNYDHERFSVSPYAYLRRGRYIDFISFYETYFQKKSIKIILFEELIKSIKVVQDTFAFLGVAEDFIPTKAGNIINPSQQETSSFPPELQSYLLDYFSEPNRRLQQQWNLNLSVWDKNVYEPNLNYANSI